MGDGMNHQARWIHDQEQEIERLELRLVDIRNEDAAFARLVGDRYQPDPRIVHAVRTIKRERRTLKEYQAASPWQFGPSAYTPTRKAIA